MCVREAGKTLVDAVAEVREAVDFLRYYAAEARAAVPPAALPGPTGESNALGLHGRGVFAAISPWNFPLAIFTGQIAAALAVGNGVVAKPAPQTPLIAARATELLHEAGVPGDVLVLLPGGPEVGRAAGGPAGHRRRGLHRLDRHRPARSTARSPSKDGPIPVLIAETGGQNAMLVDSSALVEQVVADVAAVVVPLGRPALLGAAGAVSCRTPSRPACSRCSPAPCSSCGSAIPACSRPTSARSSTRRRTSG